VWCLQVGKGLSCWDGTGWKVFAPVPEDVDDAGIVDFVPDDRDRGWMLTQLGGPTAICDFATGQWQKFPSLHAALEAQMPRGVVLRVKEHPFYEPVFARDGRIGLFTGTETVSLYEKGVWREWKLPDIAGSSAQLGGSVFFAPDGLFSVPLRREDTAMQWHVSGQAWRKREKIHVPKPGLGPREIGISVVQESEEEERQRFTSEAVDRFGVVWALRDERELVRTALGQTVSVFAPNESNPFRHGGSLMSALVDEQGNVLLDTGRGRQLILVRSKLPLPETHARLESVEDDTALIALSEENKSVLWHTWRIDGGAPQPLRKGREIRIEGLHSGKHTVEIRAYNDELTPARHSVKVELAIAAIADAQFSANLRALTSADLDVREVAARKLKSQGRSVLRKLNEARQNASTDLRWWIDAIIQHIERHSAPAPSR
jgi:hypothetical protein